MNEILGTARTVDDTNIVTFLMKGKNEGSK